MSAKYLHKSGASVVPPTGTSKDIGIAYDDTNGRLLFDIGDGSTTAVKQIPFSTKTTSAGFVPMQVQETTISAANIIGTSAGQFGHTNGVAVVDAPATGHVLELISAIVVYDYATAAYGGGGNSSLVWTGGTTSVTGVIANSALGTSAADTTNLLFPLAADGMVAYKATGLSFRTASAFTTSSGSAGVIRVKVAYRTWPTELA